MGRWEPIRYYSQRWQTIHAHPSKIIVMQMSELFRRGVVLPLDARSALQLASWEIDEAINVKWLEIPSQDLFDKIWQTGVFRRINTLCGTLISDYEEEYVPFECLLQAAYFLETEVGSATGLIDLKVNQFYIDLIDLCKMGNATRQPLYFVL